MTDHVADHNTLRTAVLAEAARFGVTVDIGGPFTIGDPGHIAEHNKMVTALQTIANAGVVTVTLPDTAHLDDTGHITDHATLLAALEDVQAAPALNDATGGTVTTYTSGGLNYRVHTFTTAGSLVVSRATHPFQIFAIGGGGGCGANYRNEGFNGGGAGYVIDQTLDLTETTYSVLVGAGGDAGGNYPDGGSGRAIPTEGGASSIAGLTAAGGGRGAGYEFAATKNGGSSSGAGAGNPGGGASGSGTNPYDSTITGATVHYGYGGTTSGTNAAPGSGGGSAGSPQAGVAGLVIVAYQVP